MFKLDKCIYTLLLLLITGMVFLPQSVYASNFCQRIYSETNPSKLSADETQSTLESLWKLYIDKQVAIVEANTTNALVSTRERAARLVQAYKNNITDAHKKIPDFKTVWNEFIKQKTNPTSEKSGNPSKAVTSTVKSQTKKNVLTEEEEQRRVRVALESIDPIKQSKKAIFHEIPAGIFRMGDVQVATTIAHPFAMMDTAFTQMMWARLNIAMGETDDLKQINPAHFKTGSESVMVMIDGIEVQMKPNHPVESVKDEILENFIKDLNELSKNGDEKMQDLLQELFPGHMQGDIYDLPTEAQREYVKRDLGLANQNYFDRDNLDIEELKKFARFDENSKSAEYPDGSTEAVTARQPRMIHGMAFYGLEGNVYERIKDWYSNSLSGGVDPKGPPRGSRKVKLGGSWNSSAEQLRTGARKDAWIGGGYDLGFRLVRTRP